MLSHHQTHGGQRTLRHATDEDVLVPVLEELGLFVNYVKDGFRGSNQLSLIEQQLAQATNLAPVSRQRIFYYLWNNIGWPDIVKPTV